MDNYEKRIMERFDLDIPSVVSVHAGNGQKEILELRTSNICAGGVFFKTEQPLAVGTEVKIELLISLDELKKLETSKTIIRVTGEVIRSEKQGMAICFENNYRIEPLYEAETRDIRETELGTGPISESLVCVAGPNRFLNKLLVSFLETDTGLKCICSTNMKLPSLANHEQARQCLVLLDCLGYYPLHVLNRFEVPVSNPPEYIKALFNVDLDRKNEREIINRGVRGIFYADESPKDFSRGILSMLRGDLWYSRSILSGHVSDLESSRKLLGESAVLTDREKEILVKIVSGARNKKIADDLHLSIHTVKSHIYNIFRKIEVKNRFQASLWAKKYF